MELAPDGRIFVAEQGGSLRVIKNGALLATPFVTVSVNAIGRARADRRHARPEFRDQPVRVRLLHDVDRADPQPHQPLHRERRQPGRRRSPRKRSSSTSTTCRPRPTTTAARSTSAPTASSTRASATTPTGRTRRRSPTGTGKLLRYNADGSDPDATTRSSRTATGANRAIWALGLRNPYTFAFQPGTGRMMINDVGQNTWEEIDEGVAGRNFGWPSTEGPTNCTPPELHLPGLLVLARDRAAARITGGAFYNPTTVTFPASYVGQVPVRRLLRRLDQASSIPSTPPANNAATTFATGASSPVDLRVAPDGSLYYLARGTGSVGRIQSSTAQPPSITQHPSPRTVPVGASATFTVSAVRQRAARLPLAAQPRRHPRRDVELLHAHQRAARRQRRAVPMHRDQCVRLGDEQRGAAHRHQQHAADGDDRRADRRRTLQRGPGRHVQRQRQRRPGSLDSRRELHVGSRVPSRHPYASVRRAVQRRHRRQLHDPEHRRDRDRRLVSRAPDGARLRRAHAHGHARHPAEHRDAQLRDQSRRPGPDARRATAREPGRRRQRRRHAARDRRAGAASERREDVAVRLLVGRRRAQPHDHDARGRRDVHRHVRRSALGQRRPRFAGRCRDRFVQLQPRPSRRPARTTARPRASTGATTAAGPTPRRARWPDWLQIDVRRPEDDRPGRRLHACRTTIRRRRRRPTR